MYASSGSNATWGWTKLSEGLPKIYVDGMFTETGSNTVVVTKNGEQQTFEGKTYEEVMDLYRTELGVEYEQLQGTDGEIPFTYVRDYLRVPDTENYTEDDIYNCIKGLLQKYSELSSNEQSVEVQKLAHTYASVILDKLARTTDEFGFTPISTDIDASEGMYGIFSILYVMDVDFDGVPELLAGTASTIGGAEYDVFSVDGRFWGNAQCASGVEYGFKLNNVFWQDTGLMATRGSVKFVEGIPAIYYDTVYDNESHTMTNVVVYTDTGEVLEKGSVGEEDFNNLYLEYLDVDRIALQEAEQVELPNVQGYLQVPDTENYTDEDVYNCILGLLEQYYELTE